MRFTKLRGGHCISRFMIAQFFTYSEHIVLYYIYYGIGAVITMRQVLN